MRVACYLEPDCGMALVGWMQHEQTYFIAGRIDVVELGKIDLQWLHNWPLLDVQSS